MSELARELAGHGPDVVVVEPADLRDGVVQVLTGALAAAAGPALAVQEPA
jgi:predicted DNA-binding transcriptional regulator YafY